MSDTLCVLELQKIQFVAASAGLQCMRRTKLCIKASIASTRPRGKFSKSPKAPKICLCLPCPANFLFGSVTEKASRGVRKMELVDLLTGEGAVKFQ